MACESTDKEVEFDLSHKLVTQKSQLFSTSNESRGNDTITVKPRYNEGPRDRQNLLVITRFRDIEVLFDIFYCYWGKENRSLYRGLR